MATERQLSGNREANKVAAREANKVATERQLSGNREATKVATEATNGAN